MYIFFKKERPEREIIILIEQQFEESSLVPEPPFWESKFIPFDQEIIIQKNDRPVSEGPALNHKPQHFGWFNARSSKKKQLSHSRLPRTTYP